MDERQREAELLRQHGLFIRENCYYATGDDDEEPSRISNFIMEPLFHIEDENNGTRIFRMRNTYNICRVIELRESELCSLNSFQQKVGSVGNYVWLAKIDKLNRVKEYLYSKTDTAERVRKLGWNATEGFFAFGNGLLVNGNFKLWMTSALSVTSTERRTTFLPCPNLHLQSGDISVRASDGAREP